MRKAADTHDDPKVKKKMKDDAKAWENGDEKTREKMLHPFLQGLAILLVTPFALVGGVLFAAGAIIWGVGKMLVGVGDLFTWGTMRQRSDDDARD